MHLTARAALIGLVSLLAAGCAGNDPLRYPGGPLGDVIVVGDERDRDDDRDGYGPRGLNVPRGHYPPPGECRIWYPDRSPGHQPPPAKCDRLVGRVPYGAFVLYNDRAWDTRYDWERHERRSRGSVPGVILRLMDSIRG